MRAIAALIAAVVLVCASQSPTPASNRSLSFEERVSAQRAIEQVYWNHRIWPKDNPGPKPSLDAVLPDAQIRARALDYMKKSNVLAEVWQRPIGAEQLQAEMNRMAASTRAPDVLRELYAALGNDPFVVAETLARQTLADRLAHDWYARDERFHGALRLRAEAALARVSSAADLQKLGATYSETTWRLRGRHEDLEESKANEAFLDADEWKEGLAKIDELPPMRLSALQESDDAFFVTSVLERGTESFTEAIASWPKASFGAWWRGMSSTTGSAIAPLQGEFALPEISTAAPCSPNTWAPIFDGAPTPCYYHATVWTGSEMIVWGGTPLTNTGARFKPSTDSWVATATVGAPSARDHHTAVWTGHEMIIWGGSPATYTGYRYCVPCASVYLDLDGDGHGNPAVTWSLCDGTAPAGYVAFGDDCDDADANNFPGNLELCDNRDNDCDGMIEVPGPEACDGRDNDCNGLIDEGIATQGTCVTSRPGVCNAGHGECVGGGFTCIADRGPGAELCNGLDDDCDGAIDEATDSDGDGRANCSDNCPDAYNPTQANADSDAYGDVCDCAVNDATNGRAPDVANSLRLSRSGGATGFAWQDGGVAGTYRLYRGFRNPGSSFAYNHYCTGVSWPTTSASDTLVPRPGTLFFYLVSRNGCSESPLGYGVVDAEIPNAAPALRPERTPMGTDSKKRWTTARASGTDPSATSTEINTATSATTVRTTPTRTGRTWISTTSATFAIPTWTATASPTRPTTAPSLRTPIRLIRTTTRWETSAIPIATATES
jgi:hypothetical protein